MRDIMGNNDSYLIGNTEDRKEPATFFTVNA